MSTSHHPLQPCNPWPVSPVTANVVLSPLPISWVRPLVYERSLPCEKRSPPLHPWNGILFPVASPHKCVPETKNLRRLNVLIVVPGARPLGSLPRARPRFVNAREMALSMTVSNLLGAAITTRPTPPASPKPASRSLLQFL